ncbi:MAG: 1-(5-phosphoribosyl)-5-[(5-phosphoribosylamino)methylideneamino]imidazole-4-carboxamide isomerase [Candidatus Omnitrophica bacterium]|nr:1-(5-phosphoribosyl)-5-[(5-phosphoribosylamino)methylideneamino]imidazole-4-carboxamide isomerase [Candidatus Omnitrophota bacterium]
MLIIPAIDLQDGKVVRLTQGAFDSEKVYSASPADVMQKWQAEGAKLVHIVDLDGAKDGKRKNLGSLKNILMVAKVPVQFGGGLRSYESVEEVLQTGVWRAVIGTKAFDTALLEKLVHQFKERIAVGLDVRDGVIQTHGWLSSENRHTLESTVQILEKVGVQTVICTDISRDGMLSGPNIELLNQLLGSTKMNVIVSGGIGKTSDLEKLSKVKAHNFEGAIIGKALYERKIELKKAMKRFGDH